MARRPSPPPAPQALALDDPQVGLLVVLLALQTEWGHHRRVEKREFLDEISLRVRLSFDITIPEMAPLIEPGDTRLVPLTFLEKRDLTDLDFTDDDGRTLPMLTSVQSGQLAANGLVGLADDLRPRVGNRKPPFEQEVFDDLATIASADLTAAVAVLDRLDALLTAGLTVAPTLADRQRLALWSDEAYREFAKKFAHSYLVCATTRSNVGERRVFHLSYLRDYEFQKMPRRLRVFPRLKELQATLGVHPRVFEAELDDRVSAASYHAEVATPGDIHVVALEVVELAAPPAPLSPPGLQEQADVLCREDGRTNRLHIRVPEAQAVTARNIRCYLQVRQRGWVRNSALMALAATALLIGAYPVLDRLARPTAKPASRVTTTCTGQVTPLPTPSNSPTPAPKPARPGKPTPWPTPVTAPVLPAEITQRCTHLDNPAPSDQSSLAATVLLALLGVAATVLTRPGDNPLASKLLGGARFLTVGIASVLFLASASLAVLGEGAGLRVAWRVFMLVTGASAIQLNYIAWKRR